MKTACIRRTSFILIWNASHPVERAAKTGQVVLDSRPDFAVTRNGRGGSMKIFRVISRIDDWADGRVRTISDHWLVVWTWLTLAMVLFTLLAWPIGVAWVTFDGTMANGLPAVEAVPGDGGATVIVGKQVGYFAALNWSLYGAVITPAMIVLIAQLWAAMPRTLDALSGAGMIRDKTFAPLAAEEVERRWRRVRTQTSAIFLIIFACVVAVAMADWVQVVRTPIVAPHTMAGIPLNHPSLEYDWSIASLYQGAAAQRDPLLAFGFVAYLLIPAVSTGLTFATLICILYFVAFICGRIGPTADRVELFAIPSDKGDKMGGFGHFASLFSMFVGLCLLVGVGCLLMIIQNAYLRDPASRTVVEFMALDLAHLTSWMDNTKLSGLASTETLWSWFFQPTRIVLENPQTTLGTLLLALTCIVSLGASWWFLGQAAKAARDRSLKNLPALARELHTTTSWLRGRLETMKFWPVGWLRINQLLVLLLCFALALISYRLLIASFILIAWLVGKAFWSAFTSPKESSE
jgi:hypothetical protein